MYPIKRKNFKNKLVTEHDKIAHSWHMITNNLVVGSKVVAEQIFRITILARL